MNPEYNIGNKDSVTVRASIQIGERSFTVGTDMPKRTFYDIVAQLCEIATQSMLDDGLRALAEDIAEYVDLQQEGGQ